MLSSSLAEGSSCVGAVRNCLNLVSIPYFLSQGWGLSDWGGGLYSTAVLTLCLPTQVTSYHDMYMWHCMYDRLVDNPRDCDKMLLFFLVQVYSQMKSKVEQLSWVEQLYPSNIGQRMAGGLDSLSGWLKSSRSSPTSESVRKQQQKETRSGSPISRCIYLGLRISCKMNLFYSLYTHTHTHTHTHITITVTVHVF